MGKQETPPQQEPQDPHSMDFQTFGYDKDDPLAKPIQESLKKRGFKEVVHVATMVFGSGLAAYAARAISEQDLQNGDGVTLTSFREGAYVPTGENVARLLIGLDIAQRLADTQHSHENILELFGQKRDTGTVYERLHTTEDKNLATLHRRLQAGVERINQKSVSPEKPPQKTQTRIYELKRRSG
jgi:hypothetical protein